MSRKRQASPVSLPVAKRRVVESWISNITPDSSSTIARASPISSVPRFASQPEPGSDYASSFISDLDDMGPKSDMSINKAPTLTPSAPGYRNELRMRRVYDFDEEINATGPSNLEELQRTMQAARESPELTDETHTGIKELARSRSNEAGLLATLLPEFAKENVLRRTSPVGWRYSKQWSNVFPLDPSQSPKLSRPEPDRSIGFKAWAFDSVMDRKVTNRLQSYVTTKDWQSYAIPCEDLFWPLVTVEGKGERGSLDQAHLQNLHNGALMLRNLMKLKEYAKVSFPFGRAFVFTVDISSETVQLNCHWVACSDIVGDNACIGSESRHSYWCRTLEAWSLRGTKRTDVAIARQAIRNCIDWTTQKTLEDIKHDLAILKDTLSQPALRTPSVSLNSQRRVIQNNAQLDATQPQSAVHGQLLSYSSHPDVNVCERLNDDSADELTGDVPLANATGAFEQQSVVSSHSCMTNPSWEVISNAGQNTSSEGSTRRRKLTPSMQVDSENRKQRRDRKK